MTLGQDGAGRGSGQSDVTIIIPSTCEARRSDSLFRAVSSLLAQNDHVPRILVVANGSRIDPAVVARIGAMENVAIEYQTEGSLPNAMRYGRSRVATGYFGFLDDDDEYLPGAIQLRLTVIQTDPAVDAVVTNGYECVNGVDRRRVEFPDRVIADPLRALLSENWLASCGGLFRTERVSLDYFDGVTRYYEWTLIAYKLAATNKIRYVDEVTFRVHDSPASLSKSRAFREAEAGVLTSIFSMDLPLDVRRAIRAKIGRVHHGLAAMYRAEGNLKLALKHHWHSLGMPGGWAYLAYSRKLLPFWSKR